MVSDVRSNWSFYACGLYAMGELMRDGIIANFYMVNIIPKNSKWPLGEMKADVHLFYCQVGHVCCFIGVEYSNRIKCSSM